MSDQPPIRDALLLKCKQAIEDLHGEVDRAQVDNRELQMQNQLLERDAERLQERVKFNERESQRSSDELKRWKARATQSEQKVEYLEEQMRAFQANADRYEEVRRNFTDLAEQNITLKQQLEDALNDIHDKNQLKEEWDSQIDQVSRRIQNFQDDNRALDEEKQRLQDNASHCEQIIREQEQQLSEVNERLADSQKREQQLKRSIDQSRAHQSDYESATQTIDKLKRQIETLRGDAERQAQEQERTHSKKINDVTMHLSRERDAIRSEALSEIEKLQRMADSLQSDVERGRVEKDRTQHEFFECRDALLQKEFQVKELRDDYTRKVDSMQKLHYEEMRKLQHIIDDQSELIHSYERVVDREKDEVGRRLGQGDTKHKDQIAELTQKNTQLQTKLVECQLELQHIQSEVNVLFQQEESKNSAAVQTLEYQLNTVMTQLKEREQEVGKLRHSYKKKKNDYSFVESDKKNLVKEIQDRDYKIEELERDRNLQYQEYQHLQLSLQRRIDDLTNEIELERKKKLNESRSDVEDKIRGLEDHYKQEIEYLKTELFRKERDFDQIQSKYDKSIQKILSSRAHTTTTLQENKPPSYDDMRTQKLPDQFSNNLKQKAEQQQQYYINNNRFQSEASVPRSQNDTDNAQLEGPPERGKKRAHQQNNLNSSRDNKAKKETEFLSKFQNVIARMENKLEKMQSELNIEAKPNKRKH